ncbi:hypothetical protein DVA86_14795 [Streptomyces armeniacus]|uniref:Uncharacterized protein n=1 Tax=Streptomyces armeniacus TaxID=83291 RepID=A0A345XQ18_9ACTN|nr:hypothetical protein [Streptomyces armeniacus]AXK33734.1 hypothetical protein DVA86_14795 [Streptomyces armeniacus]
MAAELDAMALAVPAASALVTEIARGGWESLRGAMARFLRRDGETAADRQMELLDDAAQSLAGATETDRDEVRRQLEQRLVLQLAAYLDRYPDMDDELATLLPAPQNPPLADTPTLSAQHNSGSQIVQALGDVDAGSGGINYGVPPRNPGA